MRKWSFKEVTCPESHSWYKVEPELKPRESQENVEKIHCMYVSGSLSSTNYSITQLSPGCVFGLCPWRRCVTTSVLACRKMVDTIMCTFQLIKRDIPELCPEAYDHYITACTPVGPKRGRIKTSKDPCFLAFKPCGFPSPCV